MARSLDRFTFGGRMPRTIGVLLVLTIVTSLSVAFGQRHAVELFQWLPLVPRLVHHGQIWRVVTWTLVEPGLFALVFRCLFLYWFGSDLIRHWGERRFLFIYFGTCFLAALVTCLVAFVDADVAVHPYLGSWSLDSALIVAWGLLFPDRVIRLYFIIPVRARILAWGTIVLTVGSAIFYGWEGVVPVLVAEAAMLGYIYRARLRRRWLEYRYSSLERERARLRKRSAAHLRVIEGGDNPGPLSAEDEEQLQRLLNPRRPKSRDELN